MRTHGHGRCTGEGMRAGVCVILVSLAVVGIPQVKSTTITAHALGMSATKTVRFPQ